jgi:hypothetical protein
MFQRAGYIELSGKYKNNYDISSDPKPFVGKVGVSGTEDFSRRIKVPVIFISDEYHSHRRCLPSSVPISTDRCFEVKLLQL